MYKKLVFAATVLTFIVVVLGAFVRLSDAGLGCPDWPGCYGKLAPHLAAEQIAQAVTQQGGSHGPVSLPKAWKEMVHRYLAGLLGLMIFAIAAIAWRRRVALAQSPVLPVAIVAVVAIQATLGMWTVTLLLKPAIVTGHLIGGMATLALLVWLAMRQMKPVPLSREARALAPWAALGFALVVLQIVLGGWVSTNYAALACPDLPLCKGALVPAMDFANAFHVWRELGMTLEGALLSNEALTAVHWTHRLGALIVFGYGLWLAARLAAQAPMRALGVLLAVLLCLQVALGMANVYFSLPLALAAAHNAGAAALLATFVVINCRLNFLASRAASAPRPA